MDFSQRISWPNHALQRTAPVGHAACSPQSPPRRHRARPPLSLSLGSLDLTKKKEPENDFPRCGNKLRHNLLLQPMR